MIMALGIPAQDTENDFMGENVKPRMYHKNNLENIITKKKKPERMILKQEEGGQGTTFKRMTEP